MNLTDEQRDAIIDEIYTGRKIAAIKIHRGATGQGLKESKDFIESLESRLREESPERFQYGPNAGRGAGVIALILLTAILAGIMGLMLLVE